MAAKKKPTAKQLAARKKFVEMVRARAAAKKKATTKKKSDPKKKVSGLDKVVRKGRKTDVKYTRISGIGSIGLNDIGSELLSLEFKINKLKSEKKVVRLISEKKEIQGKITVYTKQFKALKTYLNTRAKFI